MCTIILICIIHFHDTQCKETHKIKEQKGQKGSVMQPGEGYNHKLLALILCDFYI